MVPENPFTSISEEATLAWAKRFAKILKPGDVIGLSGELGTGKTIICKGICRQLGFRGDVTSPTYSIIQEYTSINPIIHLDFYRISKPEEFNELGLEYYINSSNISLIEWPDNLSGQEIKIHYQIDIQKGMADIRTIQFTTNTEAQTKNID